MSLYPDRGAHPTADVIKANLAKTIDVANGAAAGGRHPFGSILVGPTGEVLYSQGNVSTLDHAEIVLARRACT